MMPNANFVSRWSERPIEMQEKLHILEYMPDLSLYTDEFNSCFFT